MLFSLSGPKSIITSSSVSPWHLCAVIAYARDTAKFCLWYSTFPNLILKFFRVGTIGVANLLPGLNDFLRWLFSNLYNFPIASLLKIAHITSTFSGFCLHAWISWTNPLAPLTIPSSRYFFFEWFVVRIIGDPTLNINWVWRLAVLPVFSFNFSGKVFPTGKLVTRSTLSQT